jgi:heterodisulfide reductase subunit A
MSTDEKKKKPRVGVYICDCGGNISDVVDVEKVRQVLEENENVAVSRRDMFMCSNAGQELIEKDIQDDKIDRVIVASCSPSLHEMTFRGATRRGGLNEFLYEQVNIREQDSWVHSHNHDLATEKAIRLVRGGVAKAMKLDPLDTIKVMTKKRVVIIGGGVAGLKSAFSLAETGIPVDLIEKAPFLGGRVAALDHVFPTGEVSRDFLFPLIEKVISHKLITVHLNTTMEKSSGYIGNFELEFKTIHSNGVVGFIKPEEIRIAMNACPVVIPGTYLPDGSAQKAISTPHNGNYPQSPAIDWNYCTRCGECKKALDNLSQIQIEDQKITSSSLTAGVVIFATGYEHYVPWEGEYGYNKYPNVITLPQFDQMMGIEGRLKQKMVWKGKEVNSIVFIHCVGSRQIQRTNKPGQNCDGKLNEYCSRVCCTASLQGAKDVKFHYPDISVYNIYQDIRTYGRYQEERYYAESSKNGVIFLKYLAEEPPIVQKTKGNRLLVKVNDQLTFGEELEIPTDLVILGVGMVPRDQSTLINQFKLPIGMDRFLLEVHPKIRPVELAIAGIMLAGTAQAPMDINETISAALAASSKAAIILSKDFTELAPYVALVDPEICTGTGLCVQECEYEGAIAMVETNVQGEMVQRAQVNAALCKGCGACVAVCPTPNAINVRGYSLESIQDMISAFVEEVKL